MRQVSHPVLEDVPEAVHLVQRRRVLQRQVSVRGLVSCLFPLQAKLQDANMMRSKSHRAACRVKEKLLDLQLICAVCETDARHSAHICTSCTGIKYCSVKCMQANA